MGKIIRKNKNLKTDFQKKKVKLGRKLKKAQNETKTEFKARKIIIREQLAECPEYEIINKRKLSVKELLVRIAHPAVYVREDGHNGLNGIIKTYSKLEITPHLSHIVKGITPSILDLDHRVRCAAVKNIALLIRKISILMEPYFPILSSYLSCAMAHLNIGVQADSLDMMNVLIAHVPSLVAKSADSLLANYLSLITRKVSSNMEGTTSESFNFAQTLVFNPENRLTVLKFRTKLLKSLSTYLEAILSQSHQLKGSLPSSPWEIIVAGCFMNAASADQGNSEGLRILTNKQDAQKFVNTLVPILYISWVEAVPEGKNFEDTPLSSTAAEVLSCILNLFNHMLTLSKVVRTDESESESDWFVNSICSDFKSKLLQGFPYSPVADVNNSSSEPNLENNYSDINVSLASLIIYFSENDVDMQNKMVYFLINLLDDNKCDGQYKMKQVVHVIEELIEGDTHISHNMSEDLLIAALKCFKRQHASSKDRATLLNLPLKCTTHECFHLRGKPALTKWMEAVTAEAAKTGQDNLYDVLSQFKLRNISGFEEIIQKHYSCFQEQLAE